MFSYSFIYMLLTSLLITPLAGAFLVSVLSDRSKGFQYGKSVGLVISIINVLISLLIFIFFNFSNSQFQFVQEYREINSFDFYLGLDGMSVYFVLLTTIIAPITLLSNWSSTKNNVRSYIITILLLETLLLGVFVVLDILMFYIFFESILPPLFILIGVFGSNNRVRASFYLFLYTLLGSLFLLLSILKTSSWLGGTDFGMLFKTNINFIIQLILFIGVFIAFAVKTPTIFLNSWLLKAHVESPLGGSIVLAGIVLKLSLYGIFRMILPLLSKAYLLFTPFVGAIGVITIGLASFSTLRTIDVKELIAYSSVSHAAVYLLGSFSNVIQGIEGAILLGLAHGFVSSGLFICAGGVLYDRSSTRLITFYRGVTQLMPIFAIMFFILCLGNAGTPLSLNFIGEFMSLYGIFERLPSLGVFASLSIILSAAYTIYMFNRIAFGGPVSKLLKFNISDVSKREFYILLVLVVFTVVLGIYPAPILDGLHYSVSSIIYNSELLVFVPILCKIKKQTKTSGVLVYTGKPYFNVSANFVRDYSTYNNESNVYASWLGLVYLILPNFIKKLTGKDFVFIRYYCIMYTNVIFLIGYLLCLTIASLYFAFAENPYLYASNGNNYPDPNQNPWGSDQGPGSPGGTPGGTPGGPQTPQDFYGTHASTPSAESTSTAEDTTPTRCADMYTREGVSLGDCGKGACYPYDEHTVNDFSIKIIDAMNNSGGGSQFKLERLMRMANCDQQDYHIAQCLVYQRCNYNYPNMWQQVMVTNGIRGEGKIFSTFAHKMLNHSGAG